jgi:hypothetical protein
MDTYKGDGDKGRQIERLREELRTRHAVSFFSTPDQLAKEVSAAVSNVIVDRASEVLKGPPPPPPPPASPAPPAEETASTASSSENANGIVWYWKKMQISLEVAASIGRIESRADESPRASGFLVSGAGLHPQLGSDLYLLTPGHIIAPEKDTRGYSLTVDECQLRLTVPEESEELIHFSEIAWFSPLDELDTSIIRLQYQPKGVRGLYVAEALPLPGSPVNLVGHPGGRGLAFSLGCPLLGHDEVALRYLALTEPGSGGSAVLNDSSLQAIGVHRLARTVNGKRECQAVSLLAVRQALRKEFD